MRNRRAHGSDAAILVQALRQIEFAAAHVVAGLSIWNLKELGRGTQLLPQFSRAGIGMARFPRHEAF